MQCAVDELGLSLVVIGVDAFAADNDNDDGLVEKSGCRGRTFDRWTDLVLPPTRLLVIIIIIINIIISQIPPIIQFFWLEKRNRQTV